MAKTSIAFFQLFAFMQNAKEVRLKRLVYWSKANLHNCKLALLFLQITSIQFSV